MKTLSLVTFGCKVNQYESQAIRERFSRRGWRVVPPEAGADLYIVNTCGVTAVAVAEARRTVRRLARRFPSAEFTITGCAADETSRNLPGVRRVVPQAAKASLGLPTEGTPASVFDLSIDRFDGHARAFLKVQDGCSQGCSFCIIPRLRGASRSRPIRDALEEGRRLIDAGHLEIVLTGVHLGSYGRDLAGRSLLPDLIEGMLGLPGLGRLRLSSLEAFEVSESLLDLMAREPRVCPHLHLPLQSGDDSILQAMRRRYTVAEFLAACERATTRIPDLALTTDVIVGFPGETEEQFARTLDVCRTVGFSRIHVFPYSRREGTEAARLPDLPGGLKKERLHRLERLGRDLAEAFARRFLGRTVEVLMERDGTGYTERYLRARVSGPPGGLVRARAVRMDHGELLAVPL